MTTPTPRADAARPVPADVLEKCARLLGLSALYVNTRGYVAVNVAAGALTKAQQLSDGDLLLAILNKAADLGDDAIGRLLAALQTEYNDACNERRNQNFTNAALLAFAQLEPPHDR